MLDTHIGERLEDWRQGWGTTCIRKSLTLFQYWVQFYSTKVKRIGCEVSEAWLPIALCWGSLGLQERRRCLGYLGYWALLKKKKERKPILFIYFRYWYLFFTFYLSFCFCLAGFLLLWEGFASLPWEGAALHWGARASHCGGVSCCSSWALEHAFSCSSVCQIFLDQG